jgi:hypothetical protein
LRVKCQLLAVVALTNALAAAQPVRAPTSQPIIQRGAETEAAIRYRFTAEEEALLDEVQHAAFDYFWNEVGSPACLAKDRKKAPVASIAAVGFQLAALPIGVERGWVARTAAEQRARTILSALLQRHDNRKFGVYLHYPDADTAGLSQHGFEIVASTVDHALFMAGALVAAEYFRGTVAELVDRIVAETNWKAYAVAPGGFLSMGWRPDDITRLDGPGRFLDARWDWASDEERLIYFLAVGSPNPEFALPPESYYRLKRVIKQHRDMPPFVVSWPGNLFTYFFAHCFIDYRRFGPDDPQRFGIDAPRVDWFENSRRAVLTHRQRCIEMAAQYRTLAADRWGLSPCAARDGYIVPETKPNIIEHENWFEGTVAPYAAVSAIIFTPQESLAAIRAFRALRDAQGKPLIWRDRSEGGYGFVDSFNLDQGYVCDDYVGIDQGPLLLAIENARTGLIWKLIMAHPLSARARQRLAFSPVAP